ERGARHEPLPGPGRARRAIGAGDGVRGDRQPVEGGGLPGDPEPETDARLAGRGGDLMNNSAISSASPPRISGGASGAFCRSRWVEPPEGVEELDPAQLAPGFRAAGVACGIKQAGATDVGLMVCDEPDVRSALALTRNAAAAAPIRVCRDECDA